ncbi:tRNA pseudouridine(55) synthase TruB [Dehalococcoidia bacterium]|nr:tRNA pseudouridine(55) synthase TruB [Dehalococcoidia bacterium]
MSSIHGVINLNKPQGMTSFRVVARVRKLSGERKVGHSGTLDPEATGVLPILLGRATRLARFLVESPKVYRARVEFGRATTTYDASGTTTGRGDASSLTLEQIESAINSFRGPIEQIPPMYSAIKHRGRPLYHLARTGIEVPRKPRMVTIYRLDLLDWQSPILSIEVECSKGTYIRSLAHDIGQLLGCGAHLAGLVRLQTGIFHIDESISLAELEDVFEHGYWETFIHPPDSVLSHLAAIAVDVAGEDALVHGRPLSQRDDEDAASGEQRRAYSSDGRFLALIRFNAETGSWRPEKVFV